MMRRIQVLLMLLGLSSSLALAGDPKGGTGVAA